MSTDFGHLTSRKKGNPIDPRLLVRTCSECGETYNKPQVEPWNRWLMRQFCSRACWWLARSKRGAE